MICLELNMSSLQKPENFLTSGWSRFAFKFSVHLYFVGTEWEGGCLVQYFSYNLWCFSVFQVVLFTYLFLFVRFELTPAYCRHNHLLPMPSDHSQRQIQLMLLLQMTLLLVAICSPRKCPFPLCLTTGHANVASLQPVLVASVATLPPPPLSPLPALWLLLGCVAAFCVPSKGILHLVQFFVCCLELGLLHCFSHHMYTYKHLIVDNFVWLDFFFFFTFIRQKKKNDYTPGALKSWHWSCFFFFFLGRANRL